MRRALPAVLLLWGGLLGADENVEKTIKDLYASSQATARQAARETAPSANGLRLYSADGVDCSGRVLELPPVGYEGGWVNVSRYLGADRERVATHPAGEILSGPAADRGRQACHSAFRAMTAPHGNLFR